MNWFENPGEGGYGAATRGTARAVFQVETGKVINLMDALRRSLGEEKPPAKSKARKPAAKEAPAAKRKRQAKSA